MLKKQEDGKNSYKSFHEPAIPCLAQSEDMCTWDPEGVTMVLAPCLSHFPL